MAHDPLHPFVVHTLSLSLTLFSASIAELSVSRTLVAWAKCKSRVGRWDRMRGGRGPGARLDYKMRCVHVNGFYSSFGPPHTGFTRSSLLPFYLNTWAFFVSTVSTPIMGRNLKNALLAFVAPLPSLLFYLVFLKHSDSVVVGGGGDSLSPLWTWCLHHPFLLANVLFFFNVNVLFWVLGEIQSSHWMIDPYWTVIPVLLTHYYATHPLGQYNWWRSRVLMVMTWAWGLRLSHNYFRREKWQWGAREDWRFTEMRAQYGKNWWWVSFFAIYISQQVFLLGVCLPAYVVHSVDKPLNVWDFVAALVSVCGIVMAYFADTQLHEFVSKNDKLKEVGKPVVLTLDEGLWHYSRHPNYFGEQLWWWGLVIFAWNLGQGWTCVGALINSLCLAYVTGLVEERMLKKAHRAEAYRHYQRTTSVWIPWFKTSDRSRKDKAI